MPLSVFIGNLGQEPEMRMTPNGSNVTNFTLAVDSGKDTEGNRKTLWANVSTWHPLCLRVKAHLHKGNRVKVSGYPELRTFTGSTGETRAALNITAFEVKRLASEQAFDDLPDDATTEKKEDTPIEKPTTKK